jgi:hypothetical protein
VVRVRRYGFLGPYGRVLFKMCQINGYDPVKGTQDQNRIHTCAAFLPLLNIWTMVIQSDNYVVE